MKLNKFTSALVGLGVISLAGMAQAAPITIYITGSTAARANFFTACTTPNRSLPFPNAAGAGGVGIDSAAPNNVSSANQITYEGTLKFGPLAGQDVIINCSWTGSEAGIASVADATLSKSCSRPIIRMQPLAELCIPCRVSRPCTCRRPAVIRQGGYCPPFPARRRAPDFAMADTSQRVSQTPAPALTEYGIVGIVTFTAMKGFESAPDATYGRLSNVPQTSLAQAAHFRRNLECLLSHRQSG